MEQAGHECVGFCEYDKFTVASYVSMHLLTEEQREYLQTLSLKQRQKEILKEEYKNGEWYASDVRRVDAGSVPAADCWCFGFPCQDISVAGKQKGFKGNRSSLFFAVTRLLGAIEEESRPKYLFIENVKNLLSVNRGYDFARLLTELDEIGYDAEWSVLNSKDFGVPQNRERVFIVGHLRGRSGREIFPVTGATSQDSNKLELYGCVEGRNSQRDRIYSANGIAPTISTCPGGNTEPKVAIPVLTPDRAEKRQNGRRFKENGEPMFTLTSQDRHGVMIGNPRIWGGLQDHQTPISETGIRIRKLTPKECFRLQGWPDNYFYKAQEVNSNSQLYKQAGNGVTVTVIHAIAEKL